MRMFLSQGKKKKKKQSLMQTCSYHLPINKKDGDEVFYSRKMQNSFSMRH